MADPVFEITASIVIKLKADPTRVDSLAIDVEVDDQLTPEVALKAIDYARIAVLGAKEDGLDEDGRWKQMINTDDQG